LRGLQRRELEVKEYTMVDVTADEAETRLEQMLASCNALAESYKKLPFWRKAWYVIRRYSGFNALEVEMNSIIEYLSNSKNPKLIRLINCYPYKISPRNLANVTATTRELIDLCHQIKNNDER
jgi:hypothetical protein